MLLCILILTGMLFARGFSGGHVSFHPSYHPSVHVVEHPITSVHETIVEHPSTGSYHPWFWFRPRHVVPANIDTSCKDTSPLPFTVQDSINQAHEIAMSNIGKTVFVIGLILIALIALFTLIRNLHKE
jgi:hypothetical protein